MAPFAATLRALRAESGFDSARSFYRAAGAVKGLGCSYKAYLDCEAGRSLPQPRLALRLASALRLRADPRRSRAFVAAYLRSAVGREELSSFLIRALTEKAAPAGPDALFRKASEQSFARRAMPLSEPQAELLYRDHAAYWCFTLLSNDRGAWTVAGLARHLGLGERAVRTGLKSLAALDLAERAKGGAYRCQHAGKVFTYPRERFFRPRRLARLKEHWSAMARRQGKTLYEESVVVGASESALRSQFSSLAEAVYGSHIYSRVEPAPDAGIFVIEASVRRL